MAKILMEYMSQDGLKEYIFVKKRMKQGLGFVRFRNQQFWVDTSKTYRIRWPMWIIWPLWKCYRGYTGIKFEEGRPGAVAAKQGFIQAFLPDGTEVPDIQNVPAQANSYAIDLHIRHDRERKLFAEKKIDPVVVFLGLCLLVAVAGDVLLGVMLFIG